MRFKIESRDAESHARTGILTLSHGEVETPVFMPVGTAGSVKGMLPSQLEQVGARIILGNTYHLFLRPGLEVGDFRFFLSRDVPGWMSGGFDSSLILMAPVLN